MIKNVDRVVSLISLLIGLASVAISIYLSSTDSNANLVSLSGWIASAIITLTLSVTAFRALEKLEADLIKAKDDTIKYQNDLISLQNDLVSYRNISTSLSSMINPEPVKEMIRNKLAAHLDSQAERREEQ